MQGLSSLAAHHADREGSTLTSAAGSGALGKGLVVVGRFGGVAWVLAALALGVTLVFASAASAAPPSYLNAVLADSPTAYWRLGEVPGATTAADATGHGNTGTYNSVVLGGDSGIETDADTSATFSTGSWVNVGSAGGFDASGVGPLTVEAWISTLSDGGTVMFRPDLNYAYNWRIYVNSTGKIAADFLNPTNYPLYFSAVGPAVQVDDGAWHYVVVSNDGGTAGSIRIWVDGTEQDTAKVLGCPPPQVCPFLDPPAPTTPIRISGNGNSSLPYFIGDVDEVAVYNHVLSTARVAAHYTSGETYSDSSDERQLTDAERTQAINIVTGDPRFLAVAGSGYTLSDTSAWVKLSGNFLGARVEYSLSSARSITYNWPDISYDDAEGGSPPYTEGTDNETYTGVTGVSALVDLNRGVMVSLQPDSASDDAEKDQSSYYDVNGGTGDGSGCESTLRRHYILGDWFWNFDFSTDQIGAGSVGSRCKVDMPVNLIWFNNADINLAKDALAAQGFHHGCDILTCRPTPQWAAETQYMRLKDGNPLQDPPGRCVCSPHSTEWDNDRGAVQGHVVKGLRHHYRVYAERSSFGGDDRMYNTAWGYYVIATSHVDRDDHCPSWVESLHCHSWSGNSEDAERFIANKAVAAGLTVVRNAINLRNTHKSIPRGHKRFKNNGLATLIRLP